MTTAFAPGLTDPERLRDRGARAVLADALQDAGWPRFNMRGSYQDSIWQICDALGRRDLENGWRHHNHFEHDLPRPDTGEVTRLLALRAFEYWLWERHPLMTPPDFQRTSEEIDYDNEIVAWLREDHGLYPWHGEAAEACRRYHGSSGTHHTDGVVYLIALGHFTGQGLGWVVGNFDRVIEFIYFWKQNTRQEKADERRAILAIAARWMLENPPR